jgi:outer membrane protein OmpA-like peptidoglycan-associated protein
MKVICFTMQYPLKHINQTRRYHMKRFILCTLLVVAFGVYSHVQAQFKEVSRQAWGFSLGGALGDNAGNDKWGIQGRGFFQYEFVPALFGQIGIGYDDLTGHGVYYSNVLTADFRLHVIPFALENVNPYIYGGFGLSKTLNITSSDVLSFIPFGIGAQTSISSGLLLQVSGGYNLSLSNKLAIAEGNGQPVPVSNFLTNGKNDGWYVFSIGLAFTIGGNDEATESQKAELAEAEARRVKQQADADAEAQRVKAANDAETQRVKAATDAEARRVKQQADADAEAQRVKAATDAEAQRVKEANIAEAQRIKDSTNAAALRLAEQKSNDTVIVLVKGKTVVLRGVNFEFNKATLTKDSERILWRAYKAMMANPDVRVVITGHTDNVGGQKFNQTLSLKRAQTVKNWLVKKGIASNRMRTVGRGMNEPVATNETDAGRAENRRMEFYVEK